MTDYRELAKQVRESQVCIPGNLVWQASVAIEALVRERDDARAGSARMQKLDAALEAAQKHWEKTRTTYAELLSAIGCRDAGELAGKAVERDAALARVAKLEAALREAKDVLGGIITDLDVPFEANGPWLRPARVAISKIDAALAEEPKE